nr:nucleotidyltransferase family protein [Burkholderia ubonensis]
MSRNSVEVTNQAAVHLWFEGALGHPVSPFSSLTQAVASWSEYTRAVGLTLLGDGTVDVCAPYGLDDLFSMVVRRNPVRVSVDTYHRRIQQKRYKDRWPRVTIIV